MFGRAYRAKKAMAKWRGIAFELSLAEFTAIWKSSGKFKNPNYVMARIGDRGSYKVRNVEIVTRGQNVSDAFANGRHPKGAERNNAKLNGRKVAFIRSRYVPRHPRYGVRAMARKFGVAPSVVSAIINGREWRG